MDSPSTPWSSARAELISLVQRHKMVFEVYRAYGINAGECARPVGYEINIYGVHHAPMRPPTAGCAECPPVWHDLHQVMSACLPEEARSIRYELVPYQAALAYRPSRRFCPDVELVLRILPGGDPLDAAEEQGRDELIARLRALGVQERCWDEEQNQRFLANPAERGIT